MLRNIDSVTLSSKVSNINITARFIYRSYEKNETLKNDSVIDFYNEINSGSYIKISQAQEDDFVVDTNELFSEQNVLGYFNSIFLNKNIFNNFKNINFIEELNPGSDAYIFKTYDVDVVSLNNAINFNNIRNLDLKKDDILKLLFLDSILYRSPASVITKDSENNLFNFPFKNRYKEKIKNVEDSKKFFLTSINNQINKNVSDAFSVSTKKSLKIFYKKVISNNSDTNTTIDFLGHMYEKYKVVNNSLTYLNSMLSLDKKVSFNDLAVNYGEKYLYKIRSLYIVSYIDLEDENVRNYAIIANNPFVTQVITCEDYELPECPVDIDFKIKKDEAIEIIWNYPDVAKNHIKGFQILRRYSTDAPFEVIGQIECHEANDFNNQKENIDKLLVKKYPGKIINSFLDKSFDKSKVCIYAIRSISAHGQFSNYSKQISVFYDYLNHKLDKSIVAIKNCPVDYPNLFLLNNSKYVKNANNIIDNCINKKVSSIKIYFTPDYKSILDSELSDVDEQVTEILYNKKYKFTLLNMSRNKMLEHEFTITNFN
jgi:hypothetical protein